MASNTEEIDEVRTFTLSHRNQAKDVEQLVQALIGNYEIHLMSKNNIFPANSRDKDTNTEQLLAYVRNMTGVILICSNDLVSLLNNPTSQETNVDIQVSGEDVPLNAEKLRSAIEGSEEIQRKMIIVKMPKENDSIPACLNTNIPVRLPDDDEMIDTDPRLTANDIWVSETIIPNLKRLTRIIRQTSQS